uniref:Non-haem dioxygenase N-terminal domain-containing protein n=1 Tax=Chenopodium quinoa TaxID=63459 RepID=A0A803LW28_CHEQI
MFLRPLEDRLKDFGTCSDDISVPIIDFAHFGENEDRTAEIVKETILASKEWGFFQVINHGVPKELLESMTKQSQMFHEQDAETKKMFYSRDFQSKPVYFFSNHDLYQSKAANWRDTLYVNARVTNGEVDPQELPTICMDVTLEYVNHIHKLADRILMSISLEPKLTIGLDAHVDTSFITILLQDNIGGLQMITNDMIKGVCHRVIAKTIGRRISIAINYNGFYSSEKIHGPIKELTSEENPPIYKKFSTEGLIKSFFSKSLDEVRANLDDFKL